MPTEQFPDIAKAISQSNVASIAALMFDQTSWSLPPGYCTETDCWDYKVTGPSPGAGMPEEWANLAKDVLASHNHRGGVIVFGVDNGFKVVAYRIAAAVDELTRDLPLPRLLSGQVNLDESNG